MAGGSRFFFNLISLILIAGALLLMFFIIFAGAIDEYPVNRWYFLEADTSAIPGAPKLSRWTYWNGCTVRSSNTNDCGPVHPAFPLDPPGSNNFGTTVGVPSGFVGTDGYYLMTRFMFAFMLIALFFGAVALTFGVFALCTQLGTWLAALFAFTAAIFQAVQASLMTAAYTIGRNLFMDSGHYARVNTYAYAFEWTAFFCFFLAGVIYCCTGGRHRRKNKADSASTADSRQGSFFKGRSKSTRSTGSFRTKEYA